MENMGWTRQSEIDEEVLLASTEAKSLSFRVLRMLNWSNVLKHYAKSCKLQTWRTSL